MKIKFIYPKFEKFLDTFPQLNEFPQIAGLWKYTMPPALGLQILASITSEDFEYNIVDENIEKINYDEIVDLVAISFFTPQANYAYKIGDRFRNW